MKEILNKLERIAEKVASAIIGVEYFLTYNNYDGLHASCLNANDRFRWLPIQESYFGDVPEIFTAIVASGFIGNEIKKLGENKGSKGLQFFGKHFSKLTAAAVGAYYTLGETIVPQLLPGTADEKDVPAVIIASIASPFVANYLVKKWNNGLKEKFCSLFNQRDELNYDLISEKR